jgi:hypothetical protein
MAKTASMSPCSIGLIVTAPFSLLDIIITYLTFAVVERIIAISALLFNVSRDLRAGRGFKEWL